MQEEENIIGKALYKLIERKYEELKQVKSKIQLQKNEIKSKSKTIGLERFKKSKKNLEHQLRTSFWL